MVTSKRTFHPLPYEIQFQILLPLTEHDIYNWCRSCHYTYNIWNDENFWKQKTRHDGLYSFDLLLNMTRAHQFRFSRLLVEKYNIYYHGPDKFIRITEFHNAKQKKWKKPKSLSRRHVDALRKEPYYKHLVILPALSPFYRFRLMKTIHIDFENDYVAYPTIMTLPLSYVKDFSEIKNLIDESNDYVFHDVINCILNFDHALLILYSKEFYNEECDSPDGVYFSPKYIEALFCAIYMGNQFAFKRLLNLYDNIEPLTLELILEHAHRFDPELDCDFTMMNDYLYETLYALNLYIDEYPFLVAYINNPKNGIRVFINEDGEYERIIE